MDNNGNSHVRARIYALKASLAMALAIGLSSPAPAQQVARQSEDVEQLARDVERAQSLRDVKNLQYSYSQYAQFGLIDEIAALFSASASITIVDSGEVIEGPAAIRAYFVDLIGSDSGLGPDQLFTHMFYTPVVTLSYDGGSATARWTDLGMRGTVGGTADWFGGMQVNDYVLEDGVWKFSRINVHRQLAGDYERGFFATAETLPLVPYHYSAAQAGRPVPHEAGDADRSSRGLTLTQVAAQTQAMNDEDAVRNLQNIYGYYADMKMWDDVVDLFAPDGAMEIAGIGVYDGPAGIRRGLERDGPAGLQYGQIHDQIQLHTIIEVDPNGYEAQARGMQLGMLTPQLGEAYWSVATFLNSYVKIDGTWRIREMRIFPEMKADYYLGWHRSVVIDPVPGSDHAPDRLSPADTSPQIAAVIPEFFANPVTGRAVTVPAGFAIVGEDPLVADPFNAANAAAALSGDELLADARRQLDVSKAWDAVENSSSTFTYYLDDWLWDEFVQNMAVDGTRPQGAGFYIGRERMYRAMTESHLAPASLSNLREGIRLHLRIQPVINVTPDARSAAIRTRMFLYYANNDRAGAWNSGMYPNDTAVLEEGVWRMQVGGVIDETYFRSNTYEEGWARPQLDANGRRLPRTRPAAANGETVSRNGNPITFAPDIPWSLFDDYRRKDFRTTEYPFLKPMWFHYRNPVSGRTPEHYCPDILTCFAP